MGKLLLAIALLLVGSFATVVGLPSLMPPAEMTAPALGAAGQASPSAFALRDIPPDYLALIRRGAATYGLDWTLLASVLKVECDFGRNCGTSSAGAVGPAQFEPPTWAAYGVDGDGDGSKDPLDPADAVASAASYLRILGAGTTSGERAALCHYNAGDSPAFRSCMDGTQRPDYADVVLGWAARYRGPHASGRPAIVPVPNPGWLQRI